MAALVRTSCDSGVGWNLAKRIFAGGSDGHHSSLIFPNQKWLKSAAIRVLERACNLHVNMVEDALGDEKKAISLQGNAYRCILANHRPFCFKKHFEYHFFNFFYPEFAEEFVGYAFKNLEYIRAVVPPCVLFAIISTWSNAWCSAPRFQEGFGTCWICDVCLGTDSIHHYGECRIAWETFCAKYGIQVRRRNLFSFLCVDPDMEKENLIFQAVHMYAVKHAFDHARSSGKRIPLAGASSIVWEGHRTAMLYSKQLRKMFHEKWSSNGSDYPISG